MTEQPQVPPDGTGAPGSGAPDPGQPGPGTRPPPRVPTIGDLFWVGTACAISIVAAGGIGFGVDNALGTLPWFTVAGLLFGVVSAVLLAVKEFRKYL